MTDRRARLAALAARAGRNQEPSSSGDTNETSDQPEHKRQRIEDGPSDEVALPDNNETLSRVVDNSYQANEDHLEKALREAEIQETQERRQDNSSELVDLAPKKVNWDLRRDCAKKLEKLERRTQKKIIEMLKKRLESEAEGDLD